MLCPVLEQSSIAELQMALSWVGVLELGLQKDLPRLAGLRPAASGVTLQQMLRLILVKTSQ